MTSKISNAAEMVNQFNIRCGNTIDRNLEISEALKIIKNQAERVLEEAQETIDACEAGDLREVLDGGGDVFVTAIGLTKMIQDAVGDVDSALIDIGHNNNLKYTHDLDQAKEWLEFYNTEYDPNLISESYYIKETHEDTENTGMVWYCIRRSSDNKIMKPPRHPKVTISQHLYRS
jgi:hypothetical protein